MSLDTAVANTPEQVERPRSEELDKIQTLVRGAIGYDEKRGDQVSVVNLPFALVAFRLKTASRSGGAMGFVLGWLVYLGWGWKSFLMLLTFFVLGSLSTRLGYGRKAARGLGERRGGKHRHKAHFPHAKSSPESSY